MDFINRKKQHLFSMYGRTAGESDNLGIYRLVSVDSGEIWEIEENDFRWKPGYWYKRCISNVKWFREHFRPSCQYVSYIECYRNGLYYGLIGVGDDAVVWINNIYDLQTHRLNGWSYCTKERTRRRK